MDDAQMTEGETEMLFHQENMALADGSINTDPMSNLYPTIPSNVKVNSVKISDGTAVVDFSREIITNINEIPHSSTTETLAVYSIVNTLTEFEEIEKVKITVEGRDSGQIDGQYIEDFWGHIGIYEEFTRNEDIIKSS